MEQNPHIEPRPLELLGAAETAALLGLSKGALGERRRKPPRGGRPAFPRPVAQLACGPIWLRTQIEDYLASLDGRQRPLWDEPLQLFDSTLEQALHRLSLADLRGRDR